MNRALYLLWLVLWTLSSSVCAAELEVVTLKYRSAEEVVPVIRPLLAPGGTVSGLQNQLILRTTRANLAEIRKVLERVDAMPRRLMIYVRQDAEGLSAEAGGVVTAETRAAARASGEIKARIYETRGATDDSVTQRVQVLEGRPATIQIGQSVPVPAYAVTRGIGGVTAVQGVEYRDYSTGFVVVPRIAGDRVTLEISPRRETPTDSLGGADTQRAATMVSGALGEWIEIGGSAANESRRESGLLLGAAGQRKDYRSIWVKVEEIR